MNGDLVLGSFLILSTPFQEWLAINSNGMTGSVPSEWSSMTKLEALMIHDNDLVGTLDGTRFAAMSNLRHLWLSTNLFIGSIPSEIGSLSHLEDLALQSNSFRGALPSEIGGLSSLGEFVKFLIRGLLELRLILF